MELPLFRFSSIRKGGAISPAERVLIMNHERKMKGAAIACKHFYKAGNMKKAMHYWNRLYGYYEKYKLSINEYFQTMGLFTDQEVFDITDAIKERYYNAISMNR